MFLSWLKTVEDRIGRTTASRIMGGCNGRGAKRGGVESGGQSGISFIFHRDFPSVCSLFQTAWPWGYRQVSGRPLTLVVSPYARDSEVSTLR